MCQMPPYSYVKFFLRTGISHLKKCIKVAENGKTIHRAVRKGDL